MRFDAGSSRRTMRAEVSLLKTILEIDLSTASFPVGTALLKFCTEHSLSYSLHDGEVVAPRMMPAEKTHVAPAPKAATPKRKGRPAKRTKAPAAPATPKAKPAKRVAKPAAKPNGPPAPERDRSGGVSPEEQARVLAVVREKDTGNGVMCEDVYKAFGKKNHR